jgi:hypothetical protein
MVLDGHSTLVFLVLLFSWRERALLQLGTKPSMVARAYRYSVFLPLRVVARKVAAAVGAKRKTEEFIEHTITENVSTSGCYFVLSNPPQLGGRLKMEIWIASDHKASTSGRIRCRGKVVRIEALNRSSRVGVACTIDRYRLVAEA